MEQVTFNTLRDESTINDILLFLNSVDKKRTALILMSAIISRADQIRIDRYPANFGELVKPKHELNNIRFWINEKEYAITYFSPYDKFELRVRKKPIKNLQDDDESVVASFDERDEAKDILKIFNQLIS